MKLFKAGGALLLVCVSADASAQRRLPIIDVHLHAQEAPLSYENQIRLAPMSLANLGAPSSTGTR